MPAPLVKICGNTSPEDARFAAAQGADFLGVIVGYAPSPRNVELAVARQIREVARECGARFVLLSVNADWRSLSQRLVALRPDVVQLHGDETPQFLAQVKAAGFTVWAAVHNQERAAALREAGADALLIDARAQAQSGTVYGGTGTLSDWGLARHEVENGTRLVLAGGLSAENVADAIAAVQPWAVDAVSGVEERKGVKDPAKVAAFIQAAKAQP